MPSGAKNWVFTWNNPDLDNAVSLDTWPFIGYAVYQLEVGQNGTPHYQGYVQFAKKRTLAHCRGLLPFAHWEVARGTPMENRAYCTKLETRAPGHDPIEFGEVELAIRAGQRSDIEIAIATIRAGCSELQLMGQSPSFWLNHPNVIGRVRTLVGAGPQSIRESAGVTCDLLVGPPGLGKSRFAYTEYPDAYYKPDGSWFDGYEGQSTVVLEDFSGDSFPSTTLLKLIDRYPLRSPVKGGFVRMVASHFVITANDDPGNWYRDEYERRPHLLGAIHRRIGRVFLFHADGGVEEYAGPDYFAPLGRQNPKPIVYPFRIIPPSEPVQDAPPPLEEEEEGRELEIPDFPEIDFPDTPQPDYPL